MPHVELSLTDERRRSRRAAPPGTVPTASPVPPPSTSLERWATAGRDAVEACLVLRADSILVALSGSAAELFGFDDPAAATGRGLREALANLLDFNDRPGQLDRSEVEKIPPLLAISSRGLARGLIRAACPATGVITTMDAVATPLWDAGDVSGSLTFLSKI